MREDKSKLDFIRGIIREEEKEALRSFEGSDFEGKLQERIQDVPRRIFQRSRRIVWAFAATCMLLAVVVLVLVRQMQSPRVYEKDLLSAIEVFFREAPGIQMLVEGSKQEHSPHAAEAKSASAFEGFLTQKISLYRSKLHEEMKTPDADAELEYKPHLTLEERMRILIKEKELHKFLYKYLETIKEVKDEAKSLSYLSDGDSIRGSLRC